LSGDILWLFSREGTEPILLEILHQLLYLCLLRWAKSSSRKTNRIQAIERESIKKILQRHNFIIELIQEILVAGTARPRSADSFVKFYGQDEILDLGEQPRWLASKKA
jgi:hypothetical protein